MVSVIMPCYNSVTFLGLAIESVIAQTYRDWELIIVDDGSTDESVTRIRQYMQSEPRIRFYRTDRPSGSPTLPRNLGIGQALGRFIAFLDSDDVWLPDKLETQLAYFADPQVAIVFSFYEKINEEGRRAGRIVRSPVEVRYKTLLLGNVIGCLTAVYDTAKVGKVYFEPFGHEDYILWLSLLRKGFIAKNTCTVEALYRVRTRSVSSNKLKVMRWDWLIYYRIEKLGLLLSLYYFANYAWRGFIKALK